MEAMSRQQFLAAVLPSSGIRFVVTIDAGKSCVNHVVDSANMAFFEKLALEKDVYFPLASYAEKSITRAKGRTKQNAQSLKCFWLDIDCNKPNVQSYAKPRCAAEAILIFCNSLALPHPIIVKSGYGIHVYWPLIDEVTPTAWLPVANLLKGACEKFMLLADHPRTCDVASILRLPDTFNHKRNPPKKVSIALSEFEAMSLDKFESVLKTYLASPTTALAKPVGAIAEVIGTNDLMVAGSFVNLKSAQNYFELRGGALLSERDVWLKAVLLPLKCAALERPRDATEIEKIFQVVSLNFGGNYDESTNQRQWASTHANSTTIATFIAVAKYGGWDGSSKKQSDENKIVTTFNQKYAHVDLGGKIAIIGRQIDTVSDFVTLNFYSVKSFQGLHPEAFILTSASGGRQKSTRAKIWLESPLKRKFASAAFIPFGDPPNDVYNLFTGFPIAPIKGDCSKFIEHCITVVCGGDLVVSKYLFQWMAHIFLKTNEKPTVMPILSGGQGTGKGAFVNYLGALLGQYFRASLDGQSLGGQFNAELDGCILGFADEVSLKDQSQAERLKKFISEPVIRIEKKGIDAFEVKSYLRLILATNQDHPIDVSADARRFLFLKVGDQHKNDFKYFADLASERNSGGLNALIYYLMHEVSLEGFNPHHAPVTQALKDQKRNSLCPIGQWIFSSLESGVWWLDKTASIEISTQALIQKFKQDQNSSWGPTTEAIAKAIKKTLPSAIKVNRVQPTQVFELSARGWKFPPLAEARASFSAATGIDFVPES